MKRTELEQRIREAARDAGLPVNQEAGQKHGKLQVGDIGVVIPRHKEINDYTAEGILKRLEAAFGKGWWR